MTMHVTLLTAFRSILIQEQTPEFVPASFEVEAPTQTIFETDFNKR